MMGLYNEIASFTIIRLILGILFFLQGYDKVFNVGIKGVIETFEYPMKAKRIPRFFVVAAAWFTTYTELIGGIFLIAGFYTSGTLYFLGMDLILVSIALGILTPMWDMGHVFPRLVLLIALLLMPISWNVLSFDEIMKFYR